MTAPKPSVWISAILLQSLSSSKFPQCSSASCLCLVILFCFFSGWQCVTDALSPCITNVKPACGRLHRDLVNSCGLERMLKFKEPTFCMRKPCISFNTVYLVTVKCFVRSVRLLTRLINPLLCLFGNSHVRQRKFRPASVCIYTNHAPIGHQLSDDSIVGWYSYFCGSGLTLHIYPTSTLLLPPLPAQRPISSRSTRSPLYFQT